MKILVTGTAGFIGYHVAKALLERGDEVVGIDNLGAYYDIQLKYGRLADTGIAPAEFPENRLVQSTRYPRYRFSKTDLTDREALDALFRTESFDTVCNLAAQTGVRYSVENPYVYVQSNVVGFLNILEASRQYGVKHLVFASSSSIYGLNEKVPYAESDPADRPASLYAATKKSDELMAHAYSKLNGMSVVGLRFFTVYGPWGRPDMAPFLFMDAIVNDRPIQVFNNGDMLRDFTYVDDIVQGVLYVLDTPLQDPVPYKIYNIGNSAPVSLGDFIETIERCVGKVAGKQYRGMQPGDVHCTYADTTRLEQDFHYKPSTPLSEGIARFYRWYMERYR